MRKAIDFAGYKWIVTDEVATEAEQREFIKETNEKIRGKTCHK